MLGLKRLHISPFTPETLPTVLRPSISDLATEVSFHALETFPEKSYGFVTLPTPEADKLRKKLNGTTLKGAKMRVEAARPKKSLEKVLTQEDSEIQKTDRRSGRSKRNGAREEGVLPGVELEKDRKVKRGWTESETQIQKAPKKQKGKTDKKNKKSSYKAASITGQSECLFKTTVPPNAREGTKPASEKADKAKKRKRGESNGDVVVHEFANSTKNPTFLRDKSNDIGAKPVSEYTDGKGWVDEAGNLVEAEPVKKARKSKTKSVASKPKTSVEIPLGSKAQSEEKSDDATSSSGTSDSESQEESSEEEESDVATENTEEPSGKSNPKGLGISRTVERLSITRSSATPPPSSSDQPIPTLKSPEPHPLETLFKRPSKAASHTPKKPNLEVSTSFSFFDPDNQEAETRLNIPQTPFTQQDIRQRRQRSAAPTPDTAAPGKGFGNVWGGPASSDIESGDDEEKQEPAGEEEAKMLENMKEGTSGDGQESEFSKWFWEHRGENNRAWKRRRREAAKEKRQSENRKRRGH